MRLNDIARTATFRLAASFSLGFSTIAALLFLFIYWQTAELQLKHVDRFMVREAERVAGQSSQNALRTVDLDPASDLHRLTFASIFSPGKSYLSGNLGQLPGDLPTDGQPHDVKIQAGQRTIAIRAVSLRMPDGRILMIGRAVDNLSVLRQVVARALVIGLIPAILLSMLAGIILSHRTLRRLGHLHTAIERIMHGDLHERLPVRGTLDDLDRLIVSVNSMLDEVERLVGELRHAGDNIAHDVRTPLARIRARLERGRAAEKDGEELKAIVDKAIVDLDHAFTIISALLRIGEIESVRRRDGFSHVSVSDIVREVAELYQPIAEEKQLFLCAQPDATTPIQADRELLMEVAVNLVDNAIKFTPAGGTILVAARQNEAGPTLVVRDSGQGIDEADKSKIFGRFYRADKSRHIQGNGLGLSVASAIVRLHGFYLAVHDASPGCQFELSCFPQSIQHRR